MNKLIFTLSVLGLLATAPRANAQLDIRSLVAQMVANEAKPTANDQFSLQYIQRKRQDNEQLTFRVVETTEGSVKQLALVNGLPADANRQSVVDQDMHNLSRNPAERLKRQKQDKDNEEQGRKMMPLLPDAFTYQLQSNNGGMIKLSFAPNPSFRPPTKTATVFHAMAGTLEIDAKNLRLVRFQGVLISDVDFGGGLLARLKKGGTFDIGQSEVAPGRWKITSISIQVSCRALLFKSIEVHDEQQLSDFQSLPAALSFEQGLALIHQGDPANAIAVLPEHK